MLIDIWQPKPDERKQFPNAVNAFATLKHRAMRYSFTNGVTAAIALLIRDYPNALLNNFQFALPPYPVTYLEFNLDVFLRALGAPTTAQLYPDKGLDGQIGYLFHDDRVHMMVQGQNTKEQPWVGALSYSILNHGAVKNSERVSMSEDMHLAFCLGTVLNQPNAVLRDEVADELRHRIQVWHERPMKPKQIISFLQAAMGEPRNFLSLLLWINQPRHYDLLHAKAQRGYHSGKFRAYATHHIVRLKPTHDQKKLLSAVYRTGAKHRRHEVAPFWRNFEKSDCEHDFPIFPDEQGRWYCSKCPQWRVRVKTHMRGDAALGFVTKEYKV